MCVACIRLLGIPGHVEGGNEIDFKEGMFVVHHKLLFLLKIVGLLLRYWFCLIITSVKILRQVAIKGSQIYINRYI